MDVGRDTPGGPTWHATFLDTTNPQFKYAMERGLIEVFDLGSLAQYSAATGGWVAVSSTLPSTPVKWCGSFRIKIGSDTSGVFTAVVDETASGP